MEKKKLKQHVINREWCKGCGICVEFCPKKVIELDRKEKVTAVHPESSAIKQDKIVSGNGYIGLVPDDIFHLCPEDQFRKLLFTKYKFLSGCLNLCHQFHIM